MAPHRLSRLQRRILAWLESEVARTRGTVSPGHQELARALTTRGVDKGAVSRSVAGLEHKGLVVVGRTPGGKAEWLRLTPEGRKLGAEAEGS